MNDTSKYKFDRDCPDCYTRDNDRERCPRCVKALQDHLSGCGFKLGMVKHVGRPGGKVIVFVDEKPYAGFDTPEEAGAAASLWARYWPAAKEFPIRVDAK